MTVLTTLPDNATAPLAGVQLQILGAHFLLLNRLLRKSARRDYEGIGPDNPLERRMVLTLGRIGEGRVSEFAFHLGLDVAQVSRAFTALRRGGLVARGRQRDPYRLTQRGRELEAVLDTVALRRELSFTAGLDPQQMFELAGLLGHLLHRAGLIMLEELAKTREGVREGACGAEGEDGGAAPGTSATMQPVEINGRAQPLVMAIAATISRGATASFKQLTGVSNYEWRVLTNIAERPALRFSDLVVHVDSDKAQVSRTLDALVAAELVERTKARRGEPVRLELTERGDRLHDVMRDDALRRNALLTSDLRPAQRERLQGYLDLLIANAAELCAGLD